jgi:hypothetical protein
LTHPPHSSWFYQLHSSGWSVQIVQSSLWSFLHIPVTSSYFGPNILLNTLSLCPPSM